MKDQGRILMFDCTKEIVAAWDKEVSKYESDGFKLVKHRKKGKSSAAPEDLFRNDESLMKLHLDVVTIFHNIVAKTLFMMKRTRPNTSTAISFLTMRVRELDVDDWRKLQHLVEYLQATSNIPLILGADK